MKKIITILLLAFISNASMAQNRNPFVSAGIVSPAPMITGFGNCTFVTGNLGSDPLNGFVGQPMRLKITLSQGVPNNLNPLLALTGTFASKFNWTYDAVIKEYTGTQNQVINGNDGGTIIISYKTTIPSSFPAAPQNGFNVNVIPPAYTGGQPTGDDNVSSYTYASSPSTLPVRLTSFDAVVNNCVTTLSWKSAAEINFSSYQLEYSKDGVNFQTFSTVNGQGDNKSYKIVQTPSKGKAFYRLKMVDIDGKFEYSSIIALDIVCGKGSVFVYPNPASNLLNINIIGAEAKGTHASLVNQAGQTVLSKNLPNGSNQLDISSVARGVYMLTLVNSTSTENMKVVIDK